MPPVFLERVWPLVRGRLAMVFADHPSDSSFIATENDVLAGLQLLWVGWNGAKFVAAATTSICHAPARKFCMITAGFSESEKLWDRFIPMVETYARSEGCMSLRIEGRKGWARVLKGFRQPWVVLDKELA